MATEYNQQNMDVQDQFSRLLKTQVEIEKMFAERDKLKIETRILPVSIILQAFIAIATMLGAGAAIAKVFFP